MHPRDGSMLMFKLQMVIKYKKKNLQFLSIFHLLQQDRSMTNFEASKTLFQFLKIENCPHKHWSDTTNWTIAKATIKLVVQVS